MKILQQCRGFPLTDEMILPARLAQTAFVSRPNKWLGHRKNVLMKIRIKRESSPTIRGNFRACCSLTGGWRRMPLFRRTRTGGARTELWRGGVVSWPGVPPGDAEEGRTAHPVRPCKGACVEGRCADGLLGGRDRREVCASRGSGHRGGNDCRQQPAPGRACGYALQVRERCSVQPVQLRGVASVAIPDGKVTRR